MLELFIDNRQNLRQTMIPDEATKKRNVRDNLPDREMCAAFDKLMFFFQRHYIRGSNEFTTSNIYHVYVTPK